MRFFIYEVLFAFLLSKGLGPVKDHRYGFGSSDSGAQPGNHTGAGIYPEARQSAFIAVGCEQKSAVAGEYEISGMGAAAFRLLDLYSLKAI